MNQSWFGGRGRPRLRRLSKARLVMAIIHFHRRDLPHIQRDDTQHFLTFCTDRKFVIPEEARKVVLDSCLYEHERRAIVHAAVVMPNHVHLVVSAMFDGDVPFSMSEITQAIKGAGAHRVNRMLGRNGPLWQTETFDHCIRTEESFEQKIAYVISNPVRAGIVSRPREYQWVWVEERGMLEKFIEE